MTDIVVPGTIFYMAEFDDAGWQRVNMNKVEFRCSDQADDKIKGWKDGDPKIPLCTQMKKVDFTGASLRNAKFKYTDLREANFTAADLSEARIYNSIVSGGAKFLEGNLLRLRGIDIKNSDFTNAQFSPNAKFRCTVKNKKCVKLYQSDFSLAEMNGVKFWGAKIEEVDFTGAYLEGARFDCESDRNGEKPRTVLKNVCLQNAMLAGARFEGVKISNADFTGADLTDAKFKNVEFDRVVFTEEQEKTAKEFDKKSRDSLQKARREKLISEDSKEIPCSSDWDLHIKGWKDRFALLN